jgi:protein NEDD1
MDDNSVKLATCAEDVSIWRLPDTSRLHSETHVGSVKCSSWNFEGSCLATCGSTKDDHINLTFVKNNVCSTAEIMGPFGSGSSIRAIQYPRTTQKFLCVASENSVVLYDVVKKKIRQNFGKVNDISCLAMNHNDKYIAAGCQDGRLHVLNSLTGRPAFHQPLMVAEEASFTSVKFNYIKHSLLGGSTDGGSVTFWDVNAAKQLQTFNEHRAPASGLAFSPVNEVLVLSAGLDKRCVCYDTLTKKPASTIWTDQPLTSVDFALDGTNLVLGTSQVNT